MPAEKASKTVDSETSEKTEEKSSVPPAGGTVEARIGKEVIDFLRAAGYVVDGDKKPRSWTNKFLDQAIPSAVAVGAVVVGYAGITFVKTRLGDKKSRAVLETSGTPMPQMEVSVPSSRKAG
jgi:hypothetical protein